MQLTWDNQAWSWNIDLFAYNILQVYIESYRHMTYVSITTKSSNSPTSHQTNISQNRFSTNQPFPFRDSWIGRTHLGSDSNTTDGIVDGHAYTVITCLNDVAGTEHPGSKDTSLEKIFWWSGALGVKGGKTAGSFKGCQPRNEMIRTWGKDFRMFFFCFEGCSMLAHHCIGGVIWFLEPKFLINLKGKHLSCKDPDFDGDWFCINA